MAAAQVTVTSDDFYTDLPVGEILRRARLQKGMSVAEAAQYLYIREQHLEALERSDFDALPGRVYVIGFIRTYSEFLGLDGARVIHLLKRQSQGLGTPQSLNIHLLPSDSRLPGVPVLATVFAMLLLVLILWTSYQNARIGEADYILPPPVSADGTIERLEKLAEEPALPPIPEARVMDSSQIPAVLQEQPVLPPAPVPIRIVLTQDSWLEIRNPEGRVVQARVFRAGEHFDIQNPVDEFGHSHALTMGNAAGVQIEVSGKPLAPLGGVSQVRRNIALNPKTLNSLVREEF